MENAEMNLDKIPSPDCWCYSYVLCQTYCLLHIKTPQVVVLPLPNMWVVACSSCCLCLCIPLCQNRCTALSAPTIHSLSPLCLYFPLNMFDGHLSSVTVPAFPWTVGSYSAGCFNA